MGWWPSEVGEDERGSARRWGGEAGSLGRARGIRMDLTWLASPSFFDVMTGYGPFAGDGLQGKESPKPLFLFCFCA